MFENLNIESAVIGAVLYAIIRKIVRWLFK